MSNINTIGRGGKNVLFAGALCLIAALFFSASTPTTTYAACGPGEVQGNPSNSTSYTGNDPNKTGKDPTKCYKVEELRASGASTKSYEATSNKPDAAPAGNNQPGGSGSGGGGQAAPGSEEEEDKGTTCAVEKIGWILCPIVEQSAKAADRLFHFLASNFLEIDAELLTSKPPKGVGTITAWEKARDIANIMFVIAFVVIIFSQITGQGLNNYGIKRMLPRLIIAAIAVNVSYYICQILVDLSNILGYNIMRFLQDTATQIGPSVFGPSTQGTNTETADGWLGKIAIAVLAVAGIVWLILGPLAAVVGLVVITCIVVIIILLLRKAFIVLLVVASPIAFVMYLLPNTEKYFDKWLKMFWQLLMVFPIVALLLGGGQLASTIILVAGSQVNADPAACKEANTSTAGGRPTDDPSRIAEDGSGVDGECTVEFPDGSGAATWTTGLVAAGIAVAPLLAIWSVLQGALSAAGAIGGKISGAVQKGTSGGVGGIGKGLGKAKEAYKDSSFGHMRAREKRIREGKIRDGAYDGSNPWRKGRSRFNSTLNNLGRDKNNPDKFTDSLFGKYGAQRDRDVSGDRSKRAREKAEEFAGAGNYDEKFTKAEEWYQKSRASGDRNGMKEAELEMNAAMMAASRLDDAAALATMRQKFKNRSGGGGAGGAGGGANTGAGPAGGAGGTGNAPRPVIRNYSSSGPAAGAGGTVGSGGGAPSTNQPTNGQAQRLSFNSLNNNRMTRHSGNDVLGQVNQAGGWANVSDADVAASFRHAEQDIKNGNISEGQLDLYNQANAEKQSRGIK